MKEWKKGGKGFDKILDRYILYLCSIVKLF